MQYFSTFEGIKGWVGAGGALAPQKDSDLAAYSTDLDRKVAQMLAQTRPACASTART